MIKVYYLETEYQYREWDSAILEMALYFRDNFNAEIIHQKGGHVIIEEFNNYHLPDCEILIYNTDTDELKGITFADNPYHLIDVFKSRNKVGDILVIAQFHNILPINFDKNIFNFKIKEGTYYPALATTNYDFFYMKRSLYNHNLIDKMFFMGLDRGDLAELRERSFCNERGYGLNQIDYLTEAIKYKIGLSLVGVGELCHRDIEYMAIGLPMLRLEYTTQLFPPLIPNFHYISIDREDRFPRDINKDRVGGPLYVESYIKKFLDIKDDKSFLDYISKNAREYYLTYLHPSNRLKHLLNILEV